MKKPRISRTVAPRKTDPFQVRQSEDFRKQKETKIHRYATNVVCRTDTRGQAHPKGRSPAEIVVDASNGFIPLWAPNTTLRWRFQEQTFAAFTNVAAAQSEIRSLLGDAVLLWGDAVPIAFSERDDAWDFEMVLRNADDCDGGGCVLASAFFPDGGRHELVIYPKMFTQTRQEQIETLAHEVGHIFGLRHFFAQISEDAWPSEIFGNHRPFSIMNYGSNSVLTPDDRSDLKRLYLSVWNGSLTQINKTPVRLVTPFSALSIGQSAQTIPLAAAYPVSSQKERCCCCCVR